MKKILWFSLILLCLPLFSQVPRWEFDISGAAAFPRGELEEFLDEDGFGIGLRVAHRMGHSPFVVGLDFNALQLESDNFEIIYFDQSIVPGPTDLKVTSDVLMGHLSLRMQRPVGLFRPYFEGLAGVKHFDTDMKWFYDDDEDDEPVHTDTLEDDLAFSYGLGVGLNMDLKRSGPGLSFRLGCRYLQGERASYVVDDSVAFDGFDIWYATAETKTDMISFDIGLTLRF